MSTPIRIVQLYPGELGLTGDSGNVRTLEVRAERAGLAVEVTRLGRAEPLPDAADIVVLGNGPLSAMRSVADDLRARSAQLSALVEEGVSLLAVGASAELLSAGIELLEGGTLEGLGIFPFRVTRTRDRRVGYILAETEHGGIVGFEDHASEWTLTGDAVVYGTVTSGKGSFTHDGVRGETVRRGAAYATNVQGPALPLNPRWADAILRDVAARRGREYAPGTGHASLDELASRARAVIEKRIGARDFTSMGL